jgi:hypothetical protein
VNESVKALPSDASTANYVPATIVHVRSNGRYDVKFASNGKVEHNCANVSSLTFACGELVRARYVAVGDAKGTVLCFSI